MPTTTTFCFPVQGMAKTVPSIADFTRSQPGRPSKQPPGRPRDRSAAIRVRPGPGATWHAVDPAFLLLHLELRDGGEVAAVSEALVSFVVQCCIDRPGRRLRVSGPPTPATRAVKRVSELSLNLRHFFTATRCAVRECGVPVVAGNFCPQHPDAQFHNGQKLSAAATAHRGTMASPSGVAAEFRAIETGFAAWWSAMAEWLSGGPAGNRDDVCRFFVNWALDAMPMLAATTEASVDRLALLAYTAPPRVQKVQTFLNLATTAQCFRELRARSPAAARTAAGAVAAHGIWAVPLGDRTSALFRDRGIVPFLAMPVLPGLLRRGPTGIAGLVCSTILPPVSADQPAAAAIFSATAAVVMAHLLGYAGDFSFSVLHGPPPDPPGPLLDAAAPLSVRAHLVTSGEARSRAVLTVINPAALSPVVLAEIIFTLRYMHVRFCGPRLGARGIRLPTFPAAPELDPAVGFLWGVIQTEAASRNLVSAPPAADVGLLFAAPGTPGAFLDAFVRPSTPVRCAEGCDRCTAASGWHRDRLLVEMAFGDAIDTTMPPCARLGVDTTTDAEFDRALSFYRCLCDLTPDTSGPYLEAEE